jgi:uncharacterized protein involved in propanediol utilization
MEYSVKIYSRIGELMQGILSDGRPFMVSGLSSARWYSEAWVEDGEAGCEAVDGGGRYAEAVWEGGGGRCAEGLLDRKDGGGRSPLPPKAFRALSLLLEQTGGSLAGKRVGLRGNIPPGKGLASSSADILSVLSVVNTYLDAGLSAAELYTLSARVEPTDPCLSDDLFLFYQHSGVIGEVLALPPMSLVYFDTEPGGRVDTLGVVRPWTPGVGKYFDWLLARFLRAAQAGDYDVLFDSVTASAEYNQTMVGLPRFEEWLGLARETHSGLMIAHSGTIAGLLTPPERCEWVRSRLEAVMGAPVYSEHYSPLLT